jgi:hypothetical protein
VTVARRLCLALLLLLPGTALAQQQRAPLLVPGKQSLHQRVILRPGAMLHTRPGAGPGQPVDGFSVHYVFARQGQGNDAWLEIGPSATARPVGWVQAGRAIDWQHTMIAVFNNPAGRERTLFLNDQALARRLAEHPQATAEMARLRAEVAAGRPGPVIAMEPEQQVDITRRFYLLPILKAELLSAESGGPVRVLEVVSVPDEQQPPPPATPDPLREFRAGLVFVMDTTTSMGPYIERTRQTLQAVAERIRGTAVRDNFRFGMVAFRDSQEASPQGYEYTSRVIALPDFAQPPEQALEAMRGVEATSANNAGFDEDSIAGVKEAVERVDWNAFGGRYMILVTDAGARGAEDPLSSTHLGIEEVRDLAKQRGIAVAVVHLLTPEGRANHSRARAQYSELSRFEGAGQPLYFPVEGGAPEAFQQTVEDVTNFLLRRVGEATGVPPEQLRVPPPRTDSRAEQRLRVVAEAMRLAHLGRAAGTEAPDVVRSWVLDRDPSAPPGTTSLGVRMLLTRNQLSDLAQGLGEILRIGLAGRLEPANFFNQIRSAFALAARDPQRIAQANRLGGFLGEYLEGLPYVSEIMGVTEEEWLTMGGGRQRALLNRIEAKLRLYQEYQRMGDAWVNLGGNRDPGEALFPVPLESLP